MNLFRSSLKKLVLFLFITVLGMSSVNAAEPGYYPEGPQNNVSVSSISGGGWTKCYEEDLGTPLTRAIVQAACTGTYVLYAGGADADSSNYLLLAAGELNTAFTNTAENGTNLSNGSYWYFNNLSIGFSPNNVITQNSADTREAAGGATQNQRLSWHSPDEGNLGGWRIGSVNGTTSGGNNAVNDGPNAWFKAIWVSDGGGGAKPLVMTSTPKVSIASDGLLTCNSGEYGFGSSKIDLGAATYALTINGVVVSTVVYDPNKLMSASIASSSGSTYSAIASGKSAIWDLRNVKNYTASCAVIGVQNGASVSGFSSPVHDSVMTANMIADQIAKEAAEEQARSAATAANFTKEAREMRKRLAARSNP